MTNILPLNHFMCSQSSNQQEDLHTLTNNSTPSVIGEADPGSLRDSYHTPSTHLSGMGMRYVNIPGDDNRFGSETVNTHSPVYSLEPSIRSASPSSTLGISPYSNYYTPPLHNLSSYSNGHSTSGSGYFAPNTLFPSITDNIKQTRLGSIQISSGLPQSRNSPALSHISPPLMTRKVYSNHMPSNLRSPPEYAMRSPTLTGTMRGLPLSPTTTSGGFASPMSTMNENLVPPLLETEVHYNITTHDGQTVKPDIFGRIDKGFFIADDNWTCYRRNYFSLNCSYNLSPTVPVGNIFLQLSGNSGVRVQAFCMSIAAVVDGRDGKPIELVQHTPKRDKGPQERPARIVLAPRSSSHSPYDGTSGRSGIYDTRAFSPSPTRPATEATFQRIQFKNATANNGKRRAAQQYYHLLIELFADVGSQHPDRYIRIASRMSAPVVVRGRSPGHYQSERRGSGNTSNGPGGSDGGLGGPYSASAGLGRSPGDLSMRRGTSSILSGHSYSAGYDGRTHHYRSTVEPVNISIDPAESYNNNKQIDAGSCYMYYPSTIWEDGDSRCHLPTPEYSLPKIKHGHGYVLPSLSSGIPESGGIINRNCGRWSAGIESRGYFPTSFTQHEMSIT